MTLTITPNVSSELLFQTGFEEATHLAPAKGPYFHGSPAQYEDFCGPDWERLADHPTLGTLRIYHEGGDATQRYARIVPDDADSANRVLRFRIAEPNVAVREPDVPHAKSRIQTELYGNTALREFYQSVRVRFHPDIALLKTYPRSFSWFTLAEFWNKPFWSESSDDEPLRYPFRMSLGLRKRAPGPVDSLYFGAEAQMMASPHPHFRVEKVWDETAVHFTVPFGAWMTLETFYREGDQQTGRFFCAVTPEGGPRTVLFDVRDRTYHPDNPAPDGLTHYNPMKIYTSGDVVQFLRDRGAALQVDWDDFALWSGRTLENVPPKKP